MENVGLALIPSFWYRYEAGDQRDKILIHADERICSHPRQSMVDLKVERNLPVSRDHDVERVDAILWLSERIGRGVRERRKKEKKRRKKKKKSKKGLRPDSRHTMVSQQQ